MRLLRLSLDRPRLNAALQVKWWVYFKRTKAVLRLTNNRIACRCLATSQDNSGPRSVTSGDPLAGPQQAMESGNPLQDDVGALEKTELGEVPSASPTCVIDEPFSDELLVVTGFRRESAVSRTYKKGLAGIHTASRACAIM